MSHLPTLVSSYGMLKGVHVARVSQNFIGCPIYLTLQVCQPCISLHIIHGSQIQKYTIVGRGIPGMHATRWLASVLIVFLKRLADFMKKIKFCTIPTWTKFTFLHRNSKLVILTRRPNPALIIENMQKHCFSCKSFEQELTILGQIHKINFAYAFLRGSCENGAGAVLCPWDQQD